MGHVNVNSWAGIESRGPSTAERVRTLFARATAARLAAGSGPLSICRVHHLLPDGTVAVTIANENLTGTMLSGEASVLELLDSGPRPEGSVRTLVWIRGRARAADSAEIKPILDVIAATNPDPALLDVGHEDTLVFIVVDSIVVADKAGATVVEPARVVAAQPDPVSGIEGAWIRHLERHHRDMVERLRVHLPRGKRRGPLRIVGIDRYGILLTVDTSDGAREHRVPFLVPVADEAGLCRALQALMAHPCTRGLGLRGR